MKSFAFLTLLSVAAAEQFVGKLSTEMHDVSGDVYVNGEHRIILKNFKYDGAGPDAFFWIGRSGNPQKTNESTTLILAHPYEGNNYEYRDSSAPVLRKYTGETVELTLPEQFKVSDIKWFSVWCRKYSVDFGNLMFPENFQVTDSDDVPHPLAPASPEPEPETEPEPEAESEPEPEAESEPGYDHDHHHNHDAAAEPESEVEPEPKAGSAVATVTLSAILFSLLSLL